MEKAILKMRKMEKMGASGSLWNSSSRHRIRYLRRSMMPLNTGLVTLYD